MKKLKILQVGLSKTLGGMESFVMNYFRNIDKEHFSFDFADIYGEGIAYEDEIKKMGGRIFLFPNYKKHPFKMEKEYLKILEQEKYDIIHINTLSCANIIAVKAACKYKKSKIIVHSHNSSLPSGIIRHIMHLNNKVIINRLPVNKWACGIKAGKWMWGDSFNKENVVCNAVDTQKLVFNRQIRLKLRNSCGFSEQNFVIGFVGRFCEQKNVLFLLSVLEKLQKVNSEVRLLMVGDGTLKEEFVRNACEKNLNDFIYYAGFQKNVSEWYSAMDCFVLPSIFEGLPFVVIEAQAAGLQSYISNLVTSEVKVTNCVEYLPIDNDGSEWANKIAEFYCKYGIGYRHNEKIPDKYDINKSCKNLENKYLGLLEEK